MTENIGAGRSGVAGAGAKLKPCSYRESGLRWVGLIPTVPVGIPA
jgi:hypothetical protein